MKSVKVEVFEDASGFVGRIEGDTHSKVFGSGINFARTAAQAARDAAGDSLGFSYGPSAQEATARHLGARVYRVSRKAEGE